jgi:2-polyprenyl-3-methyl-5-hydroxy-6-metoxy-1,4-benzoquinol methylase
MSGTVNPEIDQDRVFDTVDHFDKFGHVMFPQQRVIYKNIARRIKGGGYTVLEAGCGNGVGTAVLERKAGSLLGTDKLPKNIAFAQELYPWIYFETWDINEPTKEKMDVVVCIETIEHVSNPGKAIENLVQAARYVLWISTPNGINRPCPPENPYHVKEYTPNEMVHLILDNSPSNTAISILHWKTFEVVPQHTKVDPLVYRVVL